MDRISRIYTGADDLVQDFPRDSEEFKVGKLAFDANHEICGIKLNLDEKRVCEIRFPNIYTSDIPKGLLNALTIHEVHIDKRREKYEEDIYMKQQEVIKSIKERSYSFPKDNVVAWTSDIL